MGLELKTYFFFFFFPRQSYEIFKGWERSSSDFLDFFDGEFIFKRQTNRMYYLLAFIHGGLNNDYSLLRTFDMSIIGEFIIGDKPMQHLLHEKK
jgi:hypothetical protein